MTPQTNQTGEIKKDVPTIEEIVKEIMQAGFDVAMGGDLFKNEEENKKLQEQEYKKVVEKYSQTFKDYGDAREVNAKKEGRKEGVDITISMFLQMNIENPTIPINIDEVKRRAINQSEEEDEND